MTNNNFLTVDYILSKIDELIGDREDLKKHIKDLSKRINEMTDNINSLVAKNALLENTKNVVENELDDLKKMFDKLTNDLDKKTKEQLKLKKLYEGIVIQNHELSKIISETNSPALKSRITHLETENENLKNHTTKLKSIESENTELKEKISKSQTIELIDVNKKLINELEKMRDYNKILLQYKNSSQTVNEIAPKITPKIIPQIIQDNDRTELLEIIHDYTKHINISSIKNKKILQELTDMRTLKQETKLQKSTPPSSIRYTTRKIVVKPINTNIQISQNAPVASTFKFPQKKNTLHYRK